MKSMYFETTELMHPNSANQGRQAFETSLFSHPHFKTFLVEEEKYNMETCAQYYIPAIYDVDPDSFISVPQY
jgi:hypothetical protein